MEALIFFAGLGVVIFGLIFWLRIWPAWLDRVRKGWSLGPTVGGKNKSPGVEMRGAGFVFPEAPLSVHALLHSPIALVGKKHLIVRYRVDAEVGATFHPIESPSAPALVSLMIQRKNDDYSAIGEKGFYRLYSPKWDVIAPGDHTLRVPLDPAGWTGVWGGQVEDEQMADVLAHHRAIHVCFGTVGGMAHGVYATGRAGFTVLDLMAE